MASLGSDSLRMQACAACQKISEANSCALCSLGLQKFTREFAVALRVAQNDFCLGPEVLRPEDYRSQGKEYRFTARPLLKDGPAVSVFTKSTGDIVSMMMRNGDNPDVLPILEALKRVQAQRNSHVKLLDVGSNLGLFSLAAASAGFGVVAFEALTSNAKIMRSSMCANNNSATNDILMYPLALSEAPAKCRLFADPQNSQDGHTCCEVDTCFNEHRLEFQEETLSLPLDWLLTADDLAQLAVAKLDAEGYEYHILRGGRNTLLSGRIKYIRSEFVREYITHKGKQDDADAFLSAFATAGYLVSGRMFEDPEPLGPHQFHLLGSGDFSEVYFWN